jgi:hypothetical protein
MARPVADSLARPLSQLRRGEATILFASGQVLRTPMDAEAARRLSNVVGEHAASEALSWTANAWVVLTGQVDACRWRPLPDDGWERPEKWCKADAAIGFHDGLLRALVEHFEARGGHEPRFSIEALGLLQSLINTGTDAETVLALAERMDGVEVAARLHALVAAVKRARSTVSGATGEPASSAGVPDASDVTFTENDEPTNRDGDE